jgi:zinc transport system substrate-binding protein
MIRPLWPAALWLAALPALAEPPRVVTDIPPVQSLAAMVMDGLGTPALLLDPGAEAHDYQLRPSQAAALQDAALLIWVGPEMTPWLERPAAARDDSARLSLLDAPGTRLRGIGEGGQDQGEGRDPHAWLDPGNAEAWLRAIAERLAAIDPGNAAAYRANAAAAEARIAALDADLAARLKPVAGRPLVMAHDAYGYFAGHYRLNVIGTVALGDAAAPGAARLSRLRATIAAAGNACLFPEPGQPPAALAALAEGTGLRIGAALDPEGALLAPGPDLYPALMTGMAAAIRDCAAP